MRSSRSARRGLENVSAPGVERPRPKRSLERPRCEGVPRERLLDQPSLFQGGVSAILIDGLEGLATGLHFDVAP